SMGTVMGSTRRAPRSRRVSQPSKVVQMPPMPEETTAPSRSPSTSGAPASCQASRAAIIAYCADGSIRLISGRVSTSSGLTLMVAAKVTGMPSFSDQSFSMVRAPDSPASAADHVVGTSPPSGVVAPRPVTTTSREAAAVMVELLKVQCVRCAGDRAGGAEEARPRGDGVGTPRSTERSGLRALDVLHGVADGREVLDLVVRDADAELVLGVGDDRHHRQRVDVEVVGEGLLGDDGVGRQAGLLGDDLGEAFEDLGSSV